MRIGEIFTDRHNSNVVNSVGTDVSVAGHDVLVKLGAALVQMTAVLPDLQPFLIGKLPWNAPSPSCTALHVKTGTKGGARARETLVGGLG